MWYTASLLFKSVHSAEVATPPLWEESIVLVCAHDDQSAVERAGEVGRNRTVEYRNSEGELVRWEFVQVERVYEVDDASLVHGTELFSRFLRDSEVKSLLIPFED